MSENLPSLPADTEDRWMAIVERVLADPAAPIENLERILAMREKERAGAALELFNRSLAAAQSELEQVAKDKPNPAFRSMYSSHSAVDAEIRPIREKYGFSWLVSQGPAENPETHIRFVGTLALGRCEKTVYLEVRKAPLEGPRGGRMAQTAVQETGSITTYMRRYLVMLAFDIVPVDNPHDDDGEGGRTVTERTTVQPPSRREQINADVPLSKTPTPDPEPGESMEDYARRVRGGSPSPPVTAPNGEDKGETIDARRRRAWIQQHYRRRCDAVTDKEAAANLLKDAQVLAFEARIEGDEALLAEFRTVRQSMVDRIWPPEPSPA